MLRLATINDLLIQPPEAVEDFVDRATLLSQLYDDFVERDEGDGHLRAPGIHASEIAGCTRKIVYNVSNTEKQGAIRKNWRQRFEVGKAIHSMVQRDYYALAAHSGGLIQFEAEAVIGPKYQEIAKKLRIYSSCDGIFTFRDDPLGPVVLRAGLEIKTEAPDGYDKLKGPKPDHIWQAHVYMKALDLPLMYFMYINKGNQNNTSSLPPFLVRFNPQIWAEIEAKCLRVLHMAENNELPAREESIICEFCPYSWTCMPNYLQRKQGGSARWKTLRT